MKGYRKLGWGFKRKIIMSESLSRTTPSYVVWIKKFLKWPQAIDKKIISKEKFLWEKRKIILGKRS